MEQGNDLCDDKSDADCDANYIYNIIIQVMTCLRIRSHTQMIIISDGKEREREKGETSIESCTREIRCRLNCVIHYMCW